MMVMMMMMMMMIIILIMMMIFILTIIIITTLHYTTLHITTTGEGIGCYVILRSDPPVQETPELVKMLKMAVRGAIGPIATPGKCV